MAKIIETIYDKDSISYFANPKEKKLLEEAEKIEKESEKAHNEYIKFLEKGKFKLSHTGVTAKVKGRFKVKLFPKIASKLDEAKGKYSHLEKNFARSELKEWGYKLSDIKKIYYADNFPALLQMKDGKQIFLAPWIDEQFRDADLIRSDIKKRITAEVKLKEVM